MSRPGAWAVVWQNFKQYMKKDWSKKHFVGADEFGNQYYELSNRYGNVSRGFEPPSGQNKYWRPGQPLPQPPIEWSSWVKGTRRIPPTDQEIALNRMKQQAQIAEDIKTAKQAPHVSSTGKGAGDTGPKAYPSFKSLEVSPGAQEDDEAPGRLPKQN
ncbi:hypothetical protein WR25_05339 [Diploscapter pachys]|uniref:NADH dehydrogenase [ubiquinone] 1 alpha subcomplex subunit 12 n=1 Tax=Diploscapter pachys TaxID=2018661 RepID=A0A2A2LJG6_9BILA|nr:hypothetical protein WR25_05339 [Diploscapter pachys]